jgi:hypothetical protein
MSSESQAAMALLEKHRLEKLTTAMPRGEAAAQIGEDLHGAL